MAGIILAKNSGLNDDLYKENERLIHSFMKDADTNQNNDDALVDAITTKVASNSFAEKFGGLTEFGDFEAVPEGGKAVQDSIQAGFSKLIEHDQFIKSFVVTSDMIEDNKVENMKKKASQFVNAWKRSRAQQVTNFFASEGTTYVFGGKTFDRTSADGKSLFATDHPYVAQSGTQSNIFTDALGADATVLYKLANIGRNFKNGSGHVMGYDFNTIMIPGDAPVEEDLIKRIIGSEKIVGSANNDINTQKNSWKLVVNHRWQKGNAAKTPFIIFSEEMMKDFDALIHMDRIPLTVKDAYDNGTWNLEYSGRYRFSVGAPIWQACIMGGASTGSSL